MSYSVRIQPVTIKQIDEYRQRFSKTRMVPETAEQWVDRVIDAMMALRYFPFRCTLAPENRRRTYEIRQLLIGD